MGGWDVLAGALAGGATEYINSRIDDYDKQEAQIRKESELRLRQQFEQENLDQRHKFAIGEADYRNRQANTRDDTRYNRELGLAKLRDKKAMELLDWQYKHRQPKVSALEQKRNFFVKTYGPEKGDAMFQASISGRGSGQFLTGAKRRIDMLAKAGLPTSTLKLREMVSEDPDYIAYTAEQQKAAKGSPLNPFDNKEPEILPPDEWAKVNKPQLYAAAVEGDQIMQQVIGGQPAGGALSGSGEVDVNRFIDKYGDKNIDTVKTGNVALPDNEIVMTARDVMKMSPEDQKKAIELIKKRSGSKNAEAVLSAISAFEKIPKKEREGFIEKMMKDGITLGDIMQGTVNGVRTGGKVAYHVADAAGKKLSQYERKLLELNNKAGRGALSLGKYAKDRFKEAYLPQ